MLFPWCFDWFCNTLYVGRWSFMSESFSGQSLWDWRPQQQKSHSIVPWAAEFEKTNNSQASPECTYEGFRHNGTYHLLVQSDRLGGRVNVWGCLYRIGNLHYEQTEILTFLRTFFSWTLTSAEVSLDQLPWFEGPVLEGFQSQFAVHFGIPFSVKELTAENQSTCFSKLRADS